MTEASERLGYIHIIGVAPDFPSSPHHIITCKPDYVLFSPASTMTTIPDSELFTGADEVKDKVVLITG